MKNFDEIKLAQELIRFKTIYIEDKGIIKFLSKKPNFHEIDGTLFIDEITAKIDAFINV